MPEGYGPFDTERQALATPAAALVQAACDAHPDDRTAASRERLKLLTETCEAAGTALGGYDLRLFEWLSQWETGQCVALAGIIRRAHLAGLAAGNAEAEWGVRFRPAGGPYATEHPAAGEADAWEVVAAMRESNPEWGAMPIVRVPERPAGPWRLAEATACRHCGSELVRCDPPHNLPVCKGWKHAAWLSMPIGAHYCDGRAVMPSGEPEENEERPLWDRLHGPGRCSSP